MVRAYELIGYKPSRDLRFAQEAREQRPLRLETMRYIEAQIVAGGSKVARVPAAVFDGLRKGSLDNRAQLYKDIASGPFFGFNRPGAKSSTGLIDSFWAQGMPCGKPL